MKRYRLYEAFFNSFYSKDLYRDVAKNWGGYTILYLFTMVALSWLVFLHRYHVVTNIALTKLTQTILPQMPPTIQVKDGIVTVPERKTYIIKSDPDQPPLLIINTATGNQLPNDDAMIRVTRDQLILNFNDVLKVYNFPKSLHYLYDTKKTNEFLKSLTPFKLAIYFVMLIFLSFFLRLLQCFFYALIGKLMAMLMQIKITYLETYRIMIVALTPVITVNTIVAFMYINLPHSTTIYFLLAMGYLSFGIYANKKS